MASPISERDIEAYLRRQVAALGGETRKVRWIGRVGAPDRLVMLPGRILWIEIKAPGKRPTGAQLREHERMRFYGAQVEVADSFSRVDEALR
jgi:hypothetical protein